jgi:hypothetical protein
MAGQQKSPGPREGRNGAFTPCINAGGTNVLTVGVELLSLKTEVGRERTQRKPG